MDRLLVRELEKKRVAGGEGEDDQDTTDFEEVELLRCA